MNARDIAREVTGLIESRYLVIGESIVTELSIELRRVETQGPAGRLGMTAQTFVAARIMPHLGVSFALILDVDILVPTFIGYKGCVGLRIPMIGHSVGSRGIAHE